MEDKDLKRIVATLKVLLDSELAVADFYDACARQWPQDADFWNEISAQERKHAEWIDQIQGIISSRPDRFSPGTWNGNETVVSTFIKGIRWNTQRIANGEIERPNAFFVARDIESAIIESKFHGIVRTDDADYLALSRQIMNETSTHLGLMSRKISGLED